MTALEAELLSMIRYWESVKLAVDRWEEVTRIIRSSEDDSHARQLLTDRFDVSDVSAAVILDVQVRRLMKRDRFSVDQQIAECTSRLQALRKPDETA